MRGFSIWSYIMTFVLSRFSWKVYAATTVRQCVIAKCKTYDVVLASGIAMMEVRVMGIS